MSGYYFNFRDDQRRGLRLEDRRGFIGVAANAALIIAALLGYLLG